MKVRVGGFFSGIGAHHSACDRVKDHFPGLEFEVVFQCDFDAKTAMAYDVLHGPTKNLKDVTIVDSIGGDLRVDILFHTPPCQDLSLAGKGAFAGKNGTRSSLMYEVPRILGNTEERERPRYLVMEEVPMLVSKKNIEYFQLLLDELSALGYRHTYGVMNAADYGVAQSRKRLFVISKLGGDPPALPKPIPLTKCLRDYLEPEPVAESYYLSEERLKGLIWSNEKEEAKGYNYRFEPTDGGGTAVTLTSRNGSRKTDNYLRL